MLSPNMIQQGLNVVAYPFVDENKKNKPYWKDIATIESYYEASMDLINVVPEFNLYDMEWPLRTYQYQFPPAKTVSHWGENWTGLSTRSSAHGTIVSGGLIQRSIIGANVRVNSYSYVTDSMIMNNCNIGRNVKIRRSYY